MGIDFNPQSKIGLVLPTFNVSRTILPVLSAISEIAACFSEILIIDNQSEDNTLELIQQIVTKDQKLKSITTLVQHRENYGYGGSIKTGFDYFCAKDVDHITILHSDNQTEPRKIVFALIEAIKKDPALDVVLGSRFDRLSNISGYSFVRRLGNYFFNMVTAVLSGCRMPDSGTAIIIVKKEVLKKIPYHSFSNTWQFHPQLNIFFYTQFRTKEVPLDWFDSDAPSRLNLVKYGLRLLGILFSYFVKKKVFNRPMAEIFKETNPQSKLLTNIFNP